MDNTCVVLKKYKYKNITISIDVYTDGTFVSSALGIFREYADKNYGKGFKTLEEADAAIKESIDDLLESTAKNYKELAEQITSSLVWTDYESCHVDEVILKILVDNFNRLQKIIL